MRRIEKVWWVLAFLIIATAGAGAQQSASPTGSGTDQTAAPKPDQEGVYHVEPGIVSPRIEEAATANPPAGIHVDHVLFIRLTAVIAADGSVKNVAVADPRESPLDDAAMTAVRQSKFDAGTLNGNPVPVLVCLRVPFFGVSEPGPRLGPCPKAGSFASLDNFGTHPHPGMKPPRLLYAPTRNIPMRRKGSEFRDLSSSRRWWMSRGCPRTFAWKNRWATDSTRRR